MDNDAAVDDNDHHLATNNAVPRNVVDIGRCAVPWRPGRSCTGQGLTTLFIGRGGWNPLSLVAVIYRRQEEELIERKLTEFLEVGLVVDHVVRLPFACTTGTCLWSRMSGVGTWSGRWLDRSDWPTRLPFRVTISGLAHIGGMTTAVFFWFSSEGS